MDTWPTTEGDPDDDAAWECLDCGQTFNYLDNEGECPHCGSVQTDHFD